jgi:hypothetical protein
MMRGDIGKTEERLIGGDSFLTITGGLSVNFHGKERIEHATETPSENSRGDPFEHELRTAAWNSDHLPRLPSNSDRIKEDFVESSSAAQHHVWIRPNMKWKEVGIFTFSHRIDSIEVTRCSCDSGIGDKQANMHLLRRLAGCCPPKDPGSRTYFLPLPAFGDKQVLLETCH